MYKQVNREERRKRSHLAVALAVSSVRKRKHYYLLANQSASQSRVLMVYLLTEESSIV